jgi:hypothetical protein
VLTKLLSPWRKLLGLHRARPIRRERLRPRRRLMLETLEDRLMPTASQVFAGLEFMTTGTLTMNGNEVTSTDPVQVGIAPANNGSFTPVLQLDKGVTFMPTDTTGSFTTTGSVSGLAKGMTLQILDDHAHTFIAPGLLASTYFSLPDSDSNMAHLKVGGGQLAVTALHIAATELDLQGTISMGSTAGLTVTVGNNDHVAMNSSGVSIAGPDPTVGAETFNFGGVTVMVQSLTVMSDQAAGQFQLSGQVTATLADNTVTVNLGNGNTPGLVITNGQVTSFNGSITSDLKFGGVTVKTQNLEVAYTAGSDLTITGEASFMFDGQTIGLALGSKGADGTQYPGIDIDPSTGNLKSLDAGINTDIEVADVTFKTENLGIQYSPGSDFIIRGSAEFDLKDNNNKMGMSDQMVGVMFGGTDGSGDMHTGIDIRPGGTLKSLDAAINADINVGGAEFKATGLGVEFDTTTGEIAVFGSASVTFSGNTAQLMLGDSMTPGLMIDSTTGQLQSLNASVTANVNIDGIMLSANGLTVAYMAPVNGNGALIEIYGDVSVMTSFLNFDSNLGTAADPGIEIIKGQLQNLNLAVTGGLNLDGVTLQANGLTIQYSASMNTLELSGGVTVQLSSAFQFSAQLAKGGLLIDPTTGALSIDAANGLEIKGSATIGPFSVQNLDIAFSNGPNGINFSATGKVMLPDNWGVNLTALTIVNGQLADIGVDITAQIPIGDTGLFLTEFGGELKNLNDPAELEIDANATIAVGETISIPSIPGIFPGDPMAALASASGSLMINASELKLTGSVSILAGLLGQGTATLDLNWGSGVYSINGSFGMYDNLITFTGGLTFDNSGDIDLVASASVNVPDFIPFIGGTSLANVNFALHFVNDGQWEDSYVAVWTDVNLFFFSFTIGFKVDFTGNFSIINGNDVASLTAPITNPSMTTTSVPQVMQYTYSYPLTIPSPYTPGAIADGTQVTVTAPELGGRGYPISFGNDTITNNHTGYVDANHNVHTGFQLSHSNVLLGSLSFSVTIDQDTVPGGIFDGTGSFDANGNFVFTPSGKTPFVPTAATLYANGVLSLQWPGDPSETTITANYTAANAYFELLQNTANGPVLVKTYSIDPVTNAPAASGESSAMPMDAMNSETVQGVKQGHFGNQGANAPIETQYSLSHSPVDAKTVKLTLYQGGTELGTGYFTSATNFVFTPKGSPALVPLTGTIIGNGAVAFTWSQDPGNTSINVSYAAGDNRLLDVNLATDTVPGGIAGSYVVELIANSTYDPQINPSFTQWDQYQAPIAQFNGTPTVDPTSGVLGGTLLADVFTPQAQQRGDPTATVSLYYNTNDDLKAGTLIETVPYSSLSNGNGPGTLNFNWTGFADLPAGDYYVYGVVNDGMNQPAYSAIQGPFYTTGAKPTLGGATSLIVTPGANGVLQGTFSSATNNALTVGPNYAAPVTVNLTVNGGGSIVLPNGSTWTQTTDPTTGFVTYSQTFSGDTAANMALDGLQFLAGNGFGGGTALTFSASVTVPMTINNMVQQVTLTSEESIPVVTANTHLVVTQSVDTTTPTDPNQAIITVTVTNPGGPDGQDGTNVQVQDYLTAGLHILAANAATGSFNQVTGLWTVGNLPMSGANSATLTLTVAADPMAYNTPLSNSATATSDLPNFPASDAKSLIFVQPQADAIVISPASLPDPVAGSPYRVQLTANLGGGGPYTFSTTINVAFPLPLPDGLTLSTNGLLSGTPTGSAPFSEFYVTATNPFGASTTVLYQVRVANGVLGVVGSPATLVLGPSTDGYSLLGINPLPPGLSVMQVGGNTVVAGTPTTAGLYPFFFQQVDPSGNVSYIDIHMDIEPAIVPATPTLPTAVAGSPYNVTFNATGGTGQIFVALAGGTLPAGLTLNGATLSGTVAATAAPGTYSFSLSYTDSSGAVVTAPYTIQVEPSLQVNQTMLAATAGNPYQMNLTATGGSGTGYSFAAISLPNGLTLSQSGMLTGMVPPTTHAGMTPIAFYVTDSNGGTAEQTLNLAVNPPIRVTPSDLSDGQGNAAYQATLTATGGSGTGYTFAVTSGQLPTGLTLSAAGVLSGTIAATAAGGYYSFAVTATDSQGDTGSVTCTLFVDPTLTLGPATLPNPQAGVAYSQQLTATGGSGIYTGFAVTAGSLPAGLTLSPTGLLTGTVLVTAPSGLYSFTVTATDSAGGTASVMYSLQVGPTVTLVTTSLPNATVNSTYSQTLVAKGGTGPYTFAITTGSLPPGLSLAANGALSGTVPVSTVPGTYAVTVTVTDSNGAFQSVSYNLVVLPVSITWTGAASTAWSNAANWSPHLIPGRGANVTIPTHSTRSLVLDTAVVTNNLVLQPGVPLTLAGHGLTVEGTLTNQGTVVLQGTEAVQLANGNDTKEGTWDYVGDGTGKTLTLLDFGASDYFNLTIADSHAHRDTFTAPADLTLIGNLSVSSGTFAPKGTVYFNGAGTELLSFVGPFANLTHNGTGSLSVQSSTLTVTGTLTNSAGVLQANHAALTVTGAATLTGGTFLAGSGADHFNHGLTVTGGTFTSGGGAITAAGVTLNGGTFTAPGVLTDTGDWNMGAGGMFNPGHGTVVLAGTNQHITGSTTFFNLAKTVTAADTLTFAAGSTQTIGGTLTLKGAANKLLSLRSSTIGTQWNIVPMGMATISFVDIEDSVALAKKPVTATRSHNSGDNNGWKFA